MTRHRRYRSADGPIGARALILAALCAAIAASCSSDDRPLFAPELYLRLHLPAGLAPDAVPCLDLVVATPAGQPPAANIGFGGSPLLVKVETTDLDGDGKPELRVRYVEGSDPFTDRVVDFVLTASDRMDLSASFNVTATARRADGRVAEDDRCLGGTAIAQGSAQRDSAGAPISFPSKGARVVDLELRCVDPAGCVTTAADGGATDGGAADGGAADGGAADGGALHGDGG